MQKRQSEQHIIASIAALANVYGNSNLIKLAEIAGEVYLDNLELAKTDTEMKNIIFDKIMSTHLISFPGEGELKEFKKKIFDIFDDTKK